MALSPATQTLIESGDRLFSQRLPLLMHWQELAEHFYYERADFTLERSIGEDYAANTYTSRPALYRREMGDMYRPMMRPIDFFEIQTLDEDLNKQGDARSWLEFATDFQRKVMYRRGAGFDRATVSCDHDHVTFGQGVIEACATPDRSGLFYRNWHLRDVVWSEDYAGNLDDVHRQCTPTLRQLVSLFGDKVPATLRKDAEKEPFKTVKARHVVARSDAYDFGFEPRADHPFVSMWVLPEHGQQLEVISRPYRGYVIPRAQTVSGSQYARSPLTGIVLPDARSMQTIERILLEAGEKAVDPPMLAKMDVLRSDMGLYAGGVTWVDQEYDDRLGTAVRPITDDYSGLPFGRDISDRFDMSIREGLKTTKVSIPDTANMTAYQVRKVIEQHMRAQIPLFGPIEVEYNEPLCSETFAVMRSLGAFPVADIPPSLRGTDIEFSFKTPIKELEADNKLQMLAEGMQALGPLAQIEEGVTALPNAMEIAKDTLRGVGWPEDWINDDKKVAQAIEAAQQRKAMEQAGQVAMAAAEGAGKAAPMVKAVTEAKAA